MLIQTYTITLGEGSCQVSTAAGLKGPGDSFSVPETDLAVLRSDPSVKLDGTPTADLIVVAKAPEVIQQMADIAPPEADAAIAAMGLKRTGK